MHSQRMLAGSGVEDMRIKFPTSRLTVYTRTRTQPITRDHTPSLSQSLSISYEAKTYSREVNLTPLSMNLV